MKDIIADSLKLTNTLATTSFEGVLATMTVATVCAAVIYVVYRFFFRGVVYGENFNILLVMTCVVTAFIIKTISANLVLSLGMVGALSIVRFRAAVKDPLDVGFIFWSVAAGLTAGAGLYAVAFLCTIFIALLYIVLNFVKIDKRVYLVVTKYDPKREDALTEVLRKYKFIVKNKTVNLNSAELTVEIKGKSAESCPVELMAVDGVVSCGLVEYNGDYAN